MATVVPTPPVLQFPDTLGIFRYFCQSVLPAVYDDSLSYYEVVCKVAEQLNKTMEASDSVNSDLQQLNEYVQQLYHYMSDDPASQFIDQLEAYIDQHLIDYVARMAYYVFPGLQEFSDGTWHYTIKVPQSWKQLNFTWIWDSTDNVWKLGLAY